jgi:hypothetical protein
LLVEITSVRGSAKVLMSKQFDLAKYQQRDGMEGIEEIWRKPKKIV